MPRTSTQGVSTYQSLILNDKEGNRVQAVLFGHDIQLHKDTLMASTNEKLLEDIIAKTLDPTSSSSTSIMPPIENLIDIGANATSPKMVNFWVRALISVKKLDRKFWYMAYNKCNKGTGV
ncbi:hypothetical protein ACB092_03G157600 [Castanea dentata]